ncbi:hypothetical protein TNCV_5090771 [Trichonephila clavipes]|nr:hypothetical protein TNCV_5090771 [Trichonephila clavipes]
MFKDENNSGLKRILIKLPNMCVCGLKPPDHQLLYSQKGRRHSKGRFGRLRHHLISLHGQDQWRFKLISGPGRRTTGLIDTGGLRFITSTSG